MYIYNIYIYHISTTWYIPYPWNPHEIYRLPLPCRPVKESDLEPWIFVETGLGAWGWGLWRGWAWKVDGTCWNLMELDGSWSRFMEVDGSWWKLMEFDGGWWRLMEVDGGWWRLMEVDGSWWRLMEVVKLISGQAWLVFFLLKNICRLRKQLGHQDQIMGILGHKGGIRGSWEFQLWSDHRCGAYLFLAAEHLGVALGRR